MHDRDSLRRYLLALPEAAEDFPFGPDPAVFRVRRKMFALLVRRAGQELINLKCNPEEARFLRDFFDSVVPAYHMNKQHWNSIVLGGDVPDAELERMVAASWRLVVAGLPKRSQPAWDASG